MVSQHDADSKSRFLLQESNTPQILTMTVALYDGEYLSEKFQNTHVGLSMAYRWKVNKPIVKHFTKLIIIRS